MSRNIAAYAALGIVITALVVLIFFPGIIYAVKDIGKSGEDLCAPQPGYTEESWLEHMGHHPNIYKDCLDAKKIKNIGPDEFENIILGEDVFVVQTHTPYEGEIEGTDLIIEDWENIENYLDKFPEDKDAKIAIYCRSGRMSGVVAERLAELGYDKIYNLEKGYLSWVDSGKKLK
jgi:rhodanese-related sulfurtransferase